MSVDATRDNKDVIRALYEDCLNARDFEALDELIADDYVGPRGEMGAEGFGKTVQSVIDAFPDIRWTVDDLIAEDDRVAVRWSWEGTHTGTFRGFLPPTGERVADHAIVIYRLRDRRVVEAWIQTDRLGFLQQLGVIPEDLTELQAAGR